MAVLELAIPRQSLIDYLIYFRGEIASDEGIYPDAEQMCSYRKIPTKGNVKVSPTTPIVMLIDWDAESFDIGIPFAWPGMFLRRRQHRLDRLARLAPKIHLESIPSITVPR